MEIRDFYGNGTVMEETVKDIAPKVQTTITVRDKEIYRELPEGATITEENVDIVVEEIENGWMKTVNRYCRFMKKEVDGEEEYDSYYNTKKYYSKNKPVDIELTYAVS